MSMGLSEAGVTFEITTPRFTEADLDFALHEVHRLGSLVVEFNGVEVELTVETLDASQA